MGKYVLVYHGGGMPESEEQQAQVMAAWEAWYGELGESILDGGNPFGQTRNVTTEGIAGANDNPVSGYTIVSATDIDDAAAKAKGCPILDAGGSIEVAETIDM